MIYIGYQSNCDGQGRPSGSGGGTSFSLYQGMFDAGDGCGHKHYGQYRFDPGDGSSLDEYQDEDRLPHYYDVDIYHHEDGNGDVHKLVCTANMEVVKL